MVTVVASVVLQLRVADSPLEIDVGDTLNVAVGTAAAVAVYVTAVLRPGPPGPIELTVTRYVPGARPLKNVVRSTEISPLASTGGLPRSEEATGDAVLGSDPFANTSRR
jgi:hypothetical protein